MIPAAWLRVQLQKISSTSDLAKAIRNALNRKPLLEICLAHGRLPVGNNTADRAIIGLASGRRIWLFAGSDGGNRPQSPPTS